MSKYIFFSDHESLNGKMRETFSQRELMIKPVNTFPEVEEGNKLVLMDGDALPPLSLKPELRGLKRKKLPVVCIFDKLDGKDVVDILKGGVVSVLFKDDPVRKIKKELKDVLYNFNYLERVKELADNDAKTRKFLDVVKTLTSNKDIKDMMLSILNAMQEVFRFGCAAFYIVSHDMLKRKLLLGQEKDSPPETLIMEDAGIQWLTENRESGHIIHINDASSKMRKKFFKRNTLLLPLVVKEKFFGFIAAVFKSSVRQLNRSELALLSAFSEQTSVALENARLYWDVIKAREDLVKEEKKSLLGQIALSLNHEINNPLSIISMEAQLLQQRMPDKEDKIEGRLANIENNIDRIKVILETISSLEIDDQAFTEYLSGREMLDLHNGH